MATEVTTRVMTPDELLAQIKSSFDIRLIENSPAYIPVPNSFTTASPIPPTTFNRDYTLVATVNIHTYTNSFNYENRVHISKPIIKVGINDKTIIEHARSKLMDEIIHNIITDYTNNPTKFTNIYIV